MKTMYHLFVNGVPKAQPRPRMAADGKVYNPHSANAWKEEIKAAFFLCRKPTLTGPVCLRVTFYLPMPKKMKVDEGRAVPHTVKPDTDNLLKAVMDAMTTVKVWTDDALVYRIEAGKYYGEKTGAQIIVEA